MTDPQAPLSDDELLSAYLDGALAGEELARAQRLLAEQPGSRQMLDELRALGSGLRELPRSRLGDSFPERVMRKAERQLLSGTSAAAQPAESLDGRWRNKRPWIYAVATLAAGLLVAVFSWPYRSAKAPMKLASAHAEHAGDSRSGGFDRDASAQAHDKLARKLTEADAKPATAQKAAAEDTTVEDDAELKNALTHLGLVQLSDQIVRQVNADEAAAPPPAADQPLAVWSCTVSRDALEQDALGRVLVRNSVQMLDEHLLEPAAGKPVDALKEMKAATELVDVVLVTATPGQLGTTLADLRSQSTTFRNLKHFGFNNLPATPPVELTTRSTAVAQTADAPAATAKAQAPTGGFARAAPGAKAKQAQPAGGGQQAASAGDQTGRAVRLRFGSQSGSALQLPANLGDAKEPQSARAKREKDGEQLSKERRSAESEQAVKLQRALFILRCPTAPAASAPATKSPAAKAEK